MNLEEAILMVRQECQKAYRVAENPLLYALGRTHQKVFKEPINMTTISPAKMTNADRVRSMSDEELAEWHETCPHIEEECTMKGCLRCVREWLQQPWEET